MMDALATIVWWFSQFPCIVRRTPYPELGPTYEFGLCHAFTAPRLYHITLCIDIELDAQAISLSLFPSLVLNK